MRPAQTMVVPLYLGRVGGGDDEKKEDDDDPAHAYHT